MELKTAAALHALSQTDITITKDNKDAQFPEIAWDKADYGVSAVVNYVVTLTNTSTNKSIVIGETGDAKLAFTNSEMNSLLAKVGAYPGQTYDFTVSLVSEAYDAYTDAASNSITFKATPYDPNVDNITWKYAYVAVGYPDWDYTTAYLIGDPDGDGIYSGYANFDGAASYAIIDGADLTKVLAKDQQVTADGKGFIEITLDAEGKVTQSEKGLVWGVIEMLRLVVGTKIPRWNTIPLLVFGQWLLRCSIRNSNLEPIMTGDSIMEQKKVNFLSWPVTWLLEVKISKW